MRSILHDRFSSAWMALVAMACYFVWQSLMRAIGASNATAWVIASVLAFGGIALATAHLVRAWPTPEPIAAPLPIVTPLSTAVPSPIAAAMRIAAPLPTFASDPESSGIRRSLILPIQTPIQQSIGWRFDESLQVILDPAIERLVPLAQPELERALVGILENPHANPPTVLNGEVVRLQRVHPAAAHVPPLLLAYTTNRREQLIPTLSLSPAADAVLDIAAARGDRHTREALQRVVATVTERGHAGSGRPQLAEHEA